MESNKKIKTEKSFSPPCRFLTLSPMLRIIAKAKPSFPPYTLPAFLSGHLSFYFPPPSAEQLRAKSGKTMVGMCVGKGISKLLLKRQLERNKGKSIAARGFA